MDKPLSNEQQQLCERLAELHVELERTQTVNQDEQAMLRHLIADIQDLLDRCSEESLSNYKPDPSLIDRLRLAIDTFEVTHPTLTVMIEKALDTLNIAGI